MRCLTERTYALVSQLRLLYSAKWPPSDFEAELIANIGASGELRTVSYLMWPLIESSENAPAAANSIAQLLAAASPDELLELEEEVRYKSSWDQSNWQNCTGNEASPATGRELLGSTCIRQPSN